LYYSTSNLSFLSLSLSHHPFFCLTGGESGEGMATAGLQRFLLDEASAQLEAILYDLDISQHYGVTISVLKLLNSDVELGSLLLTKPIEMLPLFDQAAITAQEEIMKVSESAVMMVVKPNVHIRLRDLPSCSEILKANVSAIRSRDVNHLIQVQGTVTRAGVVKMLESERMMECSTCHYKFKVFADLEQHSAMQMPGRCPSPNEGKPCAGNDYRVVEGTRVCRDYQEIRIQEAVQRLGVGSIPRSITVVVQDDLVDQSKAGDEVVVSGVLQRRWKPCARESKCDLETFLNANNVERKKESEGRTVMDGITEEQRLQFESYWERARAEQCELTARDAIVKSICPQLQGMYVVKLGVLLTVIGGVAHHDASGLHIRGENHMLLIGDPGTGKSQLLKFATKISPRSVITTGVGTTSAGLTVTAVKDSGSGEWMLEAGALVLADGGVCCIDEFDCIREHDRATIHEAMEQQTLSVAKAGLVCTLNTRTTVLAACNPKGKYDPSSSMAVNVALASPLLSRFDLIFVLRDCIDEERDRDLSDFILNGHVGGPSQPVGGARRHGRDGGGGTEDGEEEREGEREEGIRSSLDLNWPMSKLRMYLTHVKGQNQSILTAEAERILVRYYVLQRKSDAQNSARTTIRMLEGLVRITQAHARLMCRSEAREMDAIFAVFLVEHSMNNCSLLKKNEGALYSEFPDDAEAHYQSIRTAILNGLRLRSGDDEDDEAGGEGGEGRRREDRHSSQSHRRSGMHSQDAEVEEVLSGRRSPAAVMAERYGANKYDDAISAAKTRRKRRRDVELSLQEEGSQLPTPPPFAADFASRPRLDEGEGEGEGEEGGRRREGEGRSGGDGRREGEPAGFVIPSSLSSAASSQIWQEGGRGRVREEREGGEENRDDRGGGEGEGGDEESDFFSLQLDF